MRYSLAAILQRRAGSLIALGALSLLSACASTSLPQSSFMAVGAQAPAPMGYLEFCARRPEQCGLDQAADAQGAVIDAELRAQDLRRRYYWAVALAGASTPPPRLTPASGGAAADASASDRSMWRGFVQPTPLDQASAHLEPATWGGSTKSLLQPAMLRTYSLEPPLPVTPSQDLFKPQAPPELAQSEPAPSEPAPYEPAPAQYASALSTPTVSVAPAPDDPYNLREADLDSSRPVQPVTLSPELMTMLNGVNRHVNESIRYASARSVYGNADYWTLPLEAGGLRAGDCKDYVLEKRKALVEQGVPMADLSIAIVMLRAGGAHAVLLIATDHGELVLDSLSSWILPWHDLDYRWVSRQAPGQQLVWVKVASTGRG